MDAISTYSISSLAWLSIQAFPLITWPGFIASLLRDGHEQPTSLELYFARSLGFAILFFGLTTLVVSGALPIGGPDSGASANTKSSPSADAAIFLSVLHHAASAFYCYTRFVWSRDTQTAFAFGGLGSAALACLGLWCVMFSGDKGRHGKRNGFDKDTSGWPFKNSESYRSKKKGL